MNVESCVVTGRDYPLWLDWTRRQCKREVHNVAFASRLRARWHIEWPVLVQRIVGVIKSFDLANHRDRERGQTQSLANRKAKAGNNAQGNSCVPKAFGFHRGQDNSR